MPYDEDTMFPMSRALFFKMRAALRFYARAQNYYLRRTRADGYTRTPVERDNGRRALATLSEVDALWVEHDTMLMEKQDNDS